jgi:hypothetical protein
MSEMPPPLRPPLETISMLNELARHNVAGEPLSPESRDLLQHAATARKMKMQAMVEAYGSHRAVRFTKAVIAEDQWFDRLVSNENLRNASSDPSELRRTLALIHDIKRCDVELFAQLAGMAKGQRDSGADPDTAINTVINVQTNQTVQQTNVAAVLPGGIQQDSRRRLQQLVGGLLDLAKRGGQPPTPPTSSTRQERDRLVARILDEHDNPTQLLPPPSTDGSPEATGEDH